MKAFFACGHDTIKADGIAAIQLHALKQHYDGKLRLTDIKAMVLELKDHAQASLQLRKMLLKCASS